MALSEQVYFELPLPDLCVAVLRDRRKAQDVDRRAATPTQEWDETGLVFTGRYGRPVDPRHFNRRFDAMCDRAGVRRIRVHDTRHTSASLLAALDAHPRVAIAVLRHSNIAVTMDIYTDVPAAVTRDALKGSVALTEAVCSDILRRHAADAADYPSCTAWFGVRGVPVPARGDRVGGVLVSALRPVLPGRGGAAGRAWHRGRPRDDPPVGAPLGSVALFDREACLAADGQGLRSDGSG